MGSGYEGVREITKRMRYTFGWSTWAGAVDNFVYEDANDTYITDEKIRQRMMDKNPEALREMITTFLEANQRGTGRPARRIWSAFSKSTRSAKTRSKVWILQCLHSSRRLCCNLRARDSPTLRFSEGLMRFDGKCVP